MNLTTLSQRKPAAAAILLFSAIVFHAPLIFADLAYPTRDFYLHYSWVGQVAQSLAEGNWYPRWMPLAAEGLGQPVFYYYPPLFHLTAGLLSGFTAAHWAAMKLVVVASSWLAGWVTFLFMRQRARGAWPMLAGVCLQFTPLMAVVLWRLAGWPWYASFPFFLMLLYRTVEFSDERPRLDPVISLATALLVAAHVLSAFVALLCLPIVVWWNSGDVSTLSGRFRRLGAWLASCLLGLGLAAIYLYPALTTLSLISPARWGGGELDWRSSFAFSAITALRFGVRWPVFQWVVPLFVLAPVVAATLAARSPAFAALETRALIRKLVVASWVALFFSSEISYPIWKIFQPLQLVQFPSRFLFVATAAGLLADILCIAPLGAAGSSRALRSVLAAPIAASFLAALIVTGYLTATALEPVKPGELSSLGMAVPEYMPATAGSAWVDYLSRGGLRNECQSSGARCEAVITQSQRRVWEIEAPSAMQVRLPVFAFPSWKVVIDGEVAANATDPLSGLVRAAVPAGSHRVALLWTGLPKERTGAMMSILACLIWIGTCIVWLGKTSAPAAGGHAGPPLRPNL